MIGYVVAVSGVLWLGETAARKHDYSDAIGLGVLAVVLGLFAIATAIVSHTDEMKKRDR